MNALHSDHFESHERRAHATRLGTWVFLGSELLLFAGLFALYAAYRAAYPVAFRQGVEHANKLLGSLNTAILLSSSALAALAVRQLRQGRLARALAALASTIACGGAFLAIKLSEYVEHFHEGIHPGAAGAYFIEHGARGLATFWTLYFASTGLHAVHVAVGMLVLLGVTAKLFFARDATPQLHVLENATLYWHLVDLIWIFLWPLYYLA